jgi:hypothetical protein
MGAIRIVSPRGISQAELQDWGKDEPSHKKDSINSDAHVSVDVPVASKARVPPSTLHRPIDFER